ncbi:MAG: hypothetical protein Q7S74_04285 [Nanoarchaeota archaeon]|nr:hypothetical protein [Nanoarchaeota archaeon]
MITLFQIDKSGRDIFEKDYSIALILNKKEIYGINVPQDVKDMITSLYKQGKLWKLGKNEKTDKMRLRIRLHTTIIILLMQKAIKDLGYLDDLNVEICNDFDGHFHEIRDMIYKNISKIVSSFRPEDIIQTRFQKPSMVDTAARNLRERNKEAKEYNILKLNIEELTNLIRK